MSRKIIFVSIQLFDTLKASPLPLLGSLLPNTKRSLVNINFYTTNWIIHIGAAGVGVLFMKWYRPMISHVYCLSRLIRTWDNVRVIYREAAYVDPSLMKAPQKGANSNAEVISAPDRLPTVAEQGLKPAKFTLLSWPDWPRTIYSSMVKLTNLTRLRSWFDRNSPFIEPGHEISKYRARNTTYRGTLRHADGSMEILMGLTYMWSFSNKIHSKTAGPLPSGIPEVIAKIYYNEAQQRKIHF